MSCRSRYDSTGQRLQIIREGDVVDIDGESDTVWHAVSPRVLQVARDYFDCTDLNELPLMGENILGPSQRGSHWETRILNDEFMAYGQVRLVMCMPRRMNNHLAADAQNFHVPMP